MIIFYYLFLYLQQLNKTNMEDNFDEFSVLIESDVLSQDFDDVDLYGDKIEEENSDGYDDNIQFE